MKNDEKWTKYGKLLSGLIHNLNTPLMGISGRVELLQMKMGEDKSIKQISTQVEKINSMLTAVGYLVDKDQYDKDIETDIAVFLDNYFNFINADMRYKHQVPSKELNFTPCKLVFNPSDLLYCLHTVFDYTLDFVDSETNITISNTDTGIINLSFKLNNTPKENFELGTLIDQNIDIDTRKIFAIQYTTNENLIDIQIEINR